MTDNALPEPMTPRELDILRGMVEGLSNAEIADRLVLSAGTVKWYVKQLYSKLGAHSREEAVAQAVVLGLVAVPTLDDSAISDEWKCPLINPLPQDVSGRYVGNAQKLAQLAELLRGQARLISIYGRAGSGKTALVCKALGDLQTTERNRTRLTGIVCLSAVGTGITLDRLLPDIGRLLTEKDQSAIDNISRNSDLSPAQKISLLLERIASKRIVLLLDNLETVQQPASGELVEPGLRHFVEMAVEKSSALTLILTSREPLPLPRTLKTREHLISLEDGLPPEDGIALLRKFDPSGVTGLSDAPSDTLREISERLGGFPRALEAVAGILLEDPLLRLIDVQQNLDALEGELSSAVVEDALAHLNNESMRVMQALAIFAQPVSYEALTFLLTPAMSEATLRATLGRLIRACFVKTSRASQQFGLHPLDQAYCYARIPASMQQNDGEEAAFTRTHFHRRAADYYKSQALPRSAWQRLPDLDPQINEFKHRISAGDGDEAAKVLLEIDRDHLWEWGYKDLLRQLYPMVDGLLNDPLVAHHVARRRAWLKFFEAPQEADLEFTDLLKEAQRRGFVKEEADALDDLAQTCRRGNFNLGKGIEYHQQALTLYREIGDRRGEADALGGLGAIYSQVEPEEAIDYLLAAADIQRDLGNTNSLSFLLTMMGTTYESLGALEQAVETLNEALRIARETNSLEALIRAYGTLASIFISQGDIARGRTCIEDALAMTVQLTGALGNFLLYFFVCIAGVNLALVGEPDIATDLISRLTEATAILNPDVLLSARGLLSMTFMFTRSFQKARSLVLAAPVTPTGVAALLSREVMTTYWFGVLLVKTGEIEAASVFLQSILELVKDQGTNASESRYLQSRLRPIRAVAQAGLALIHHDSRMVETALQIYRETKWVRGWQTNFHRGLITLLIEEPGGDMLLPIREVIDARLRGNQPH